MSQGYTIHVYICVCTSAYFKKQNVYKLKVCSHWLNNPCFLLKTLGKKKLDPKSNRKSRGKPYYVRLRKAVLERINS